MIFLARSSFLKFIIRRILKNSQCYEFQKRAGVINSRIFLCNNYNSCFFILSLGSTQKACDQTSICSLRLFAITEDWVWIKTCRSLNRPWVPPPKVRTVPNSKDPAGKPSCNVSTSCCFLHRFRYDKFLLSFINCQHICNQFARYCQCCSVSIPFANSHRNAEPWSVFHGSY